MGGTTGSAGWGRPARHLWPTEADDLGHSLCGNTPSATARASGRPCGDPRPVPERAPHVFPYAVFPWKCFVSCLLRSVWFTELCVDGTVPMAGGGVTGVASAAAVTSLPSAEPFLWGGRLFSLTIFKIFVFPGLWPC